MQLLLYKEITQQFSLISSEYSIIQLSLGSYAARPKGRTVQQMTNVRLSNLQFNLEIILRGNDFIL